MFATVFLLEAAPGALDSLNSGTVGAPSTRHAAELDVPDIGYQSQTPSQPILATAAADEACRAPASRLFAAHTPHDGVRQPASCESVG